MSGAENDFMTKKSEAMNGQRDQRPLHAVVSLFQLRKLVAEESRKAWITHAALKAPSVAGTKQWFNGYATGMDWILQITKTG